MNSNFAFLPPAFKDLAEASSKAEEQIMGDPRAAHGIIFSEQDALL